MYRENIITILIVWLGLTRCSGKSAGGSSPSNSSLNVLALDPKTFRSSQMSTCNRNRAINLTEVYFKISLIWTPAEEKLPIETQLCAHVHHPFPSHPSKFQEESSKIQWQTPHPYVCCFVECHLQGIVKEFVAPLKHLELVYPMSPPQGVPFSGERCTNEK